MRSLHVQNCRLVANAIVPWLKCHVNDGYHIIRHFNFPVSKTDQQSLVAETPSGIYTWYSEVSISDINQKACLVREHGSLVEPWRRARLNSAPSPQTIHPVFPFLSFSSAQSRDQVVLRP